MWSACASTGAAGHRDRRGATTGSHFGPPRPPAPAAGALPAGLVAAALRQFDVRLDGIDIVSVRTCDTAADGDTDTGPADDQQAPAVSDTAAPATPG